MSLTEIQNIWPGSPVLSVITVFAVAVILFYLARSPAHKAIYSLTRVIQNGMRLMARSLLIAEKKMVQRNREVLLNSGAKEIERLIEREFHRVDAIVTRDLSGYPALQRQLADRIARIDEDHHESIAIPPPPPEWIKAVDAVAKLSVKQDGTVGNILGEIQKTTKLQFKNVTEEYRKAVGTRHSLLEKMMPHWRKVSQTLNEVSKTITGLHEHAKIIDTRMTEYEEIQNKTDKAIRILTSSSMTQFFISAFVLLIAIGGAVINFNLIALPMSEMVGGGSYIGGFKTSNIAAMVIILVEIVMGLFLMESLRITGLFPIIGHMDDKMRTRMIWITFSFLFILASIESSLAFMRDRIAADMQALRHTLIEAEATAQTINSWIPTVGQMVMGFILPFVLTFVAIPLESFVNSARTVLGSAFAALLRLVAFLLRLLGNISRYTGVLLMNLYDLLVFPLLWVENLIRKKEQHTDIIAKEETS